MEALIIYDETGKIWLIAHGETKEPKGLKWIKTDLPEGAQVTGMDVLEQDRPSPVFSFAQNEDGNTNLLERQVANLRKRMAAGENLRMLIGKMNLTDAEKWELEKKVKEG